MTIFRPVDFLVIDLSAVTRVNRRVLAVAQIIASGTFIKNKQNTPLFYSGDECY
jgi:hypothetical protein